MDLKFHSSLGVCVFNGWNHSSLGLCVFNGFSECARRSFVSQLQKLYPQINMLKTKAEIMRKKDNKYEDDFTSLENSARVVGEVAGGRRGVAACFVIIPSSRGGNEFSL